MAAPVIKIEGLTYSYPRSDLPALSDVHLQASDGEFIGIVGANGAGKSTLCYAVSGFVPHFYKGILQGKVDVAGHNVADTPLGNLTGDIGLVFQNPFNQITGARYSVREEVAFGLENLGIPREEMATRVDDILLRTGLAELAERSPFELSGGQQQRLAIASVIVMEPQVLVLDEPTSQLDPLGTREVFTTLQSLAATGDTTVVLATHKVDWLANFADRVAVLSEGRLLALDIPQDVLTNPDFEDLGITSTRYTQAARLAQQQGVVKRQAGLPVTLDRAVRYFDAS